MISCVVDALEKRDVATMNIPGAFMHTEIDDKVHMQLHRKMDRPLVQLDCDKYGKHLIREGNTEVSHVRRCKALYRTVDVRLLKTLVLQTERLRVHDKPLQHMCG
jgi:hypothetical protein